MDKEAALRNLALELDSRTARLRSQQETLAQSLLTRGEMRISRLPRHIRTMTVSAWIAQSTAVAESNAPIVHKTAPLALASGKLLNAGVSKPLAKRKASASPVKQVSAAINQPSQVKRMKQASTASPLKPSTTGASRRTRTAGY
ncbi:hypothetical protein BCR37DRAFT_104294 [Protomyces lactucae-debilis]|uniref:Borealin N-terminal domain-containing protein n=1 Tax=Protomyces lactucae-debilis TaxID=2754530 RepID=A0A1Y2F858_PROLT|nr:uncharacterized protein BCR37DRAFT_104294 [Protomyces lactucae-debilis]ORY79105.1 hypothetical protein BCR37DRAFT_104294 [Protomyces lactucae-debilis]